MPFPSFPIKIRPLAVAPSPYALVLPSFPCPHAHQRMIDWRFVNAVSPDDSAVAPSAPSLLPLQEDSGEGSGGSRCPRGSDACRGLVTAAGRTGRDSAGGSTETLLAAALLAPAGSTETLLAAEPV